MKHSSKNPKQTSLLGAFAQGAKKCGFLFVALAFLFVVLCILSGVDGGFTQMGKDFIVYIGLAAVIVSLPWSLIGSEVLDVGNLMIPIGILTNCLLLGFFSRFSAHLSDKIDERIEAENDLIAQQVREESGRDFTQGNH